LKLYSTLTCVKDLLTNAYNTFESTAKAKKLAFEMSISNNVPKYIVIDDKRLNQIVYNFMENSLKYTFAGKISLSCQINELSNLKIAISDSGIGIKSEKQQKIFKIFECSNNNKSDGIGLGLYISKMLAIKMGGDIKFSSKEGIGSIFTVSVPYFKRSISDLSLVSKCGLAIDKCCPTVLIVDDNNFNLVVLESMLRKSNISCDKALNGKIALDKILESQQRKCCSPYTLVLMDCNMPVMDGYEATERIMTMISEKEIAPMTVIGVTAYTSTEHLDNCIKSGMKCASIVLISLQTSEVRGIDARTDKARYVYLRIYYLNIMLNPITFHELLNRE
jgi:CheY-like chemotaxis protein